MARVRKDVWKLPVTQGQVWSDTVLWYARGVGALLSRPITDSTSWNSLGAMHGYDPQLWADFGFVTSSPPTSPLWQQCQHQTWYFLPWHRGYLAAFESIVLDAIVKLGGPADWALPYWNYSDSGDANALQLPAAFAEQQLPSGDPNPLFVSRRYGDGTGNVVIDPRDVDLTPAMRASQFAGSSTRGGSTGFGGPQTDFQHSGSGNGILERQPHNGVHTLVGGFIAGADQNDPHNWGLMSNPDTAALDPIFWLHHANIDRLWQVWLNRPGNHTNPTAANWLTGPPDQTFAMPKPDGSTYNYAAQDVLDTNALGYIYEDTSDPLGGVGRIAARFARLGAPQQAVAAATRPGVAAMAEEKPVELLGANAEEVQLTGGSVDTQVRMDAGVSRKMINSFRTNLSVAAPKEPDRVFLNLEGVRGANDGAAFYVYVNLPQDANPTDYPQNLAGVVSLFGVTKASRADDKHGGNGINETLEITDIVDALHLNNKLDLDHLTVRFVPRTKIQAADKISVRRVSVYRQGD